MYRMNFWARFHRQFHWSLDFLGVLFDYKGDEVTWLWPWKRNSQNRKWLSASFGCVFNSLKDLDELWNKYVDEMKKD